jgi:uncharacterized membrane protein (DUF2068 family)
MTTPAAAVEPRFGILRVIALYKLVKVLLLLATAYEVVRLRNALTVVHIYAWIATLPSGLERDLVRNAMVWFSGLSDARVEALRAVTLAYATIFAVEGIGLWMRRRWAEWLTIVVTGSLIPLEIWELIHRPNFSKVGVIIVNVAIVWYLIVRVRKEHRAAAARA